VWPALVVAFAIARWATASRALLPFAIAANWCDHRLRADHE